MPTNISNAIGTARQFTPQPDSGYVGRYREVTPSRVFGKSGDTTLGENIYRLNNALQSFIVNHEKIQDQIGLDNAQRMINAETPEDVMKLNALDAAQSYGFADDTANPYFRAYAEKLRGGLMATKMKREYDAMYSMSPMKDMDSEAKRFEDFSKEWKKQQTDGESAPNNQYAFDSGYNENNLVNINNLWGEWNEKKHKEDIVTTMAMVQSSLGNLIQQAPELLKENGALTKAAQSIFNEARLMGLPPEYRQKLLTDWANEFVATGHIDAVRFEQMMNNLDIQTSIDGSTVKAADLLDMQSYATQAMKFRGQFMTKNLFDTMQSYIENKDGAGWQALVDSKQGTDEYPIYAAQTGHVLSSIKSQIEADKRKQEREMERRYRQKDTDNKTELSTNEATGAIDAWLNGDTEYCGVPISAISTKAPILYSAFTQKLANLVANDDWDGVVRLMDYPKATAFRETLKHDILNKFNAVKVTGDNNDITIDSTLAHTMQFFTSNANQLESMFGKEVAEKATQLQALASVNPDDFQSALRQFAIWNSATDDMKSSAKDAIDEVINNNNDYYDVEGIEDISGAPSRLEITNNGDIEGRFNRIASMFYICGMSADEAVSSAGSAIADNYVTYRGCALPKGIFKDLVGDGSRDYFERALEDQFYEADFIRYDPDNQIFYGTFSDGTTLPVYLSDIRENAKVLYLQDYEDYVAQQNAPADTDKNTDMTVDEVNNAREDKSDDRQMNFDEAIQELVD